MIVPPNMWYHQHFNAGTQPARYLAFEREVVSIRNAQGVPKAWISQRIGGDQIDYADESSWCATRSGRRWPRSGSSLGSTTSYEPGAGEAAAHAGVAGSRVCCHPERAVRPLAGGPHVVVRGVPVTHDAPPPRHARHDHEEPVYGREHAEPQTVHSPHVPDHDHDHDDDAICRSRTTRSGSRTTSPCTASAWTSALRHPGGVLPAAPAADRRGADQPLHRRPPRHRVPLPGRADPLRQRRARSTPRRSARSSTARTGRPASDPGDRHRRGDPHRRGAAPHQRRGHRRHPRRARRELVTATAGHNMEAMLAAYGSGAAKVSYDEGLRILNVDIGGGTTKLALLDRGQVLAHRRGPRRRPAAGRRRGRPHRAARAGRPRRTPPGPGSTGTSATRAPPTRSRRWPRRWPTSSWPPSPPIRCRPRRGAVPTDPLGPLGGDRRRDVLRRRRGVRLRPRGRLFGDLGGPLGRAIRRRVDSGALPFPLLPAGECIRATALGASEYSVQLSGNTGWISDPDALLPRRNLQVLRPVYELGDAVDADDRGRRDPPAPRRARRGPRRRRPGAGDVLGGAAELPSGCSRSPAASATGSPSASPRAARST